MSIRGLITAFNRNPVWHRTLNVWGLPITACTFDRLLYLTLHRWGRMGSEQQDFFRRHIKPGKTVVEAGANIGLYTLLFSKLVGATGKVISFEPDPELFEALKRNVTDNHADNVVVHQKALGSKTESRVLCKGLFNRGDNRLSNDSNESQGVKVEVARLDDMFRGQSIDFLKMDVQGWEPEVLKGMTGLMETNPEMGIYFEYWPEGLLKAGFDPIEFIRTFEKAGWTITTVPKGRILKGRDLDNEAGDVRGYVDFYAVRI